MWSPDAFSHDLRSAARALRASRVYAAWVVGSLAIGMAVTIAGLALLNAGLILPFPEVREQHRLVRVSVSRNCGRADCWTRMSSLSDYEALQDGLRGLQGLAAYTQGEIAVGLPAARSMRGVFTSANYFEVLGVRPVLGRPFTASDRATNAAVAVVSHSAWVREFGGDSSVIGRTIRVADRFVHIVGVAPDRFIGVDRVRPGSRGPDVWLPIWMVEATLSLTADEQRRQEREMFFVGRLREESAVAQVQAEAAVLASRLAAARAATSHGGSADVRRVWRVNPENWHFGVIVVMPIPILVLAIACVNAANLMLARGSERRREIAIRLAVGAGRSRMVRQLLLESAVLALVAIGVALPLAWWGLQLASSPLGEPVPVDRTVLALSALTVMSTTIAFGLAPAVRVSAQHPSSTLGSAGARDAIPRESHLRRLLIVAQVALSLGLLGTAWQLVSTVRSQAVSGGTPQGQLLIVRFNLEPVRLPAERTDTFYRDLVAGAQRLAGVEAAGIARHTSIWTFGQGAAPASLRVWGPGAASDDGHHVIGGYAGGDVFEAVGLRTIAGRRFSDADRLSRPQVVVVNQTFAEGMRGPALGSVLRVAPRNAEIGSSIEARIVGVIEPAREPRLEPDRPPAPKVYLPSPIQPEPALALYVRTRGDAALLAEPVRQLVQRIDSRVPIQELGTLNDYNERSYAPQLWLARAAAFVGVIGVLLATAGLYGVSSYVVALRTREMAIRMALGARPSRILSMLVAQSLRVIVSGLVVGGSASIVVSRLIQSEYHGITGMDALAFAGAVALFLATMLLASLVPALRASRVDPVQNLKDA